MEDRALSGRLSFLLDELIAFTILVAANRRAALIGVGVRLDELLRGCSDAPP